jgi:hypothetical protein
VKATLDETLPGAATVMPAVPGEVINEPGIIARIVVLLT